MKLGINSKRRSGKSINIKHHTLMDSQWVKEEIKGEIRKYLGANKNENENIKTYGMQHKQY